MERINDIVFGEMIYKHSWTKKDSFIFLDKAYVVNITAQAYKGDNILESQQENFRNFKDFINNNSKNIEQNLKDYLKNMFNIEGSLTDLIEPKTIIFERDNSWGILFETDYDIENGIALFIQNDEIKVCPQDEFI